jgi:hypothetical protein
MFWQEEDDTSGFSLVLLVNFGFVPYADTFSDNKV